MISGWLKATTAGVELRVKVQPRAAKNEVVGAIGDELKVRVSAPPVESAANEAVVVFLAEILGLSRGSVVLLRGGSSRHKVLFIRGLPVAEIVRRLVGK